MSDYPMLISNKLHSFRNFLIQISHSMKSILYFIHESAEASVFSGAIQSAPRCPLSSGKRIGSLLHAPIHKAKNA